MRRRTFLRSTAGIAAASGSLASAGPFALSAEAPPAPARPRLRIGLLGASHSHAPGKIQAVRESADWELVGIHEPSEKVRGSLGLPDAIYLSQDDLLSRCEVVAVESAVRDHARHAKVALSGGKHVHLEKPAAARLADLDEILDLARVRKLVLQVGYMWRHHPGVLALQAAARGGWLGEIVLVRASINTWVPPERRGEWAEFAGGSMFELGSHLIDAVVRMLGRPTAVTPILRGRGEGADALRDLNAAVLEYPRALAVITNTTWQPDAGAWRSIEVVGTNGTAQLRPIEPPALEVDLEKAAGPYPAGRRSLPVPAYRRYVDDLVELAAAVRGERALSVTLEEERLVGEVILRASGMEPPSSEGGR